MNVQADQTKSFETASITRSAAVAIIAASRSAAQELGIEISVAVTDPGGYMKAFECSDGARFLTVEVATNKAWTAAAYGIPTHLWNSYFANPNVAPLGNVPRIMAVAGGYPILEKGQLVGAVGVSGGDYLEDSKIAETALQACGFELPATYINSAAR